jgi:DNA repair protein RecO (recombination protein O)
MLRNSATEAVVLRKVRVGEIHKSLTLLSPSKGLISAMAHGAFKIRSKLRTASEPFNVIRAYLYHEPVRNQYKITDIESLNPLEGIRRNVLRYFAASLWAEVTIKSYAAGQSYGGLYSLLLEALEILDGAVEKEVPRLIVQYLMRFLELLGQRPDLEHCALCSKPFESESGFYLCSEEGTFVCRGCTKPTALFVPEGARRYLLNTMGIPLRATIRIGLEQRSLDALKAAAYGLIQAALETKLNALNSGVGIL